MVFEVGETVVYPHHGAAKIEEIKMRTVKGEEKMYLKLKVAQGDLTIEVPAENVDLVGVRDVVGKDGLEHVFDVLRAEFTEEPTERFYGTDCGLRDPFGNHLRIGTPKEGPIELPDPAQFAAENTP